MYHVRLFTISINYCVYYEYMSNKIRFSLVIISAVLLSACTAEAPNMENQAGEKQNTDTEESKSTSMRDLLGMGKNQKCIINTSLVDDDGTVTDTQGTIYIAGKKWPKK